MSQTTFWNLLKENKIEIPIIQRDYAQGREGKEYLRQTFLESLKKALDENKVLKLDFVYGSTENNALQPLDGQQRLTTLWLLHWYIAMRAGKLHEAGDTLKKFTYETRISSREFCEELCKSENFESFDGNNIVSYITSQTWFYSSWKQDPTIQSMLRMLGGTQIKGKSGNDIPDGIEEVFKDKKKEDFSGYWDKLESDNAPIVFYYLPLKDFGLSDDLYIKMNARGKQLTNFENFKADLVGYIKKKAEEENEKWKNLASSVNGIPAKLDMEWTDIFWQNKTDDGRIDEIYFAFLNRYFLYSLLQRDNLAENLQEDKIFIYLYGSNGNDTDLQYTSKAFEFDKFPELHSSLESLEKTLDNLYKSISDENSKISSEKFSAIKEAVKAPWKKDPDDNSFCFIPEYKSNIITNLTQSHRVVFFAVCKYFENKKYKEQSFKRWMRIVWNIVENSNVNNISSMQGCMKLIKDLAEESFENREDNGNEDYCIYELLCTLEDGFVEKSFAKEQLKEEIAKAKQILDGDQLKKYNDNKTWEDVIIEAENYAFFKGAIRFLFRNENGEWDWKDFDTKWGNAKKYFKKECQDNNKTAINEEWDNAGLLQKLIKNFFSIEYINGSENKIGKIFSWWWNKRLFNNNVETWSFYLLESYICKPIHDLLCDNNNISVIKEINHNDYKKYEKTIYYLTQTNLLDYVLKKIPFSWIRNYYDHYAIFPSSTGIFLDAENRNKILLTMDETKIICINEEHKIPDNKELLFGTNITFRYPENNNSYKFRWDFDDYIYLLNEGRSVKDKDGQDIKFSGESITDKDSLIRELNACIEKYEKLQSE